MAAVAAGRVERVLACVDDVVDDEDGVVGVGGDVGG